MWGGASSSSSHSLGGWGLEGGLLVWSSGSLRGEGLLLTYCTLLPSCEPPLGPSHLGLREGSPWPLVFQLGVFLGPLPPSAGGSGCVPSWRVRGAELGPPELLGIWMSPFGMGCQELPRTDGLPATGADPVAAEHLRTCPSYR